MATSSTYTVTKTAADLADSIMRVVATGGSPTSAEQADIIEAINFWLFQIQEPPFVWKPGEFMWLRETADITLSAKIAFDLKPSGGDCDIQIPLEILTATLKDTSSNETPMSTMSLQEFQAISNKTNTGTPSRFYYERRRDTGKFYLDIIPSVTTDVVDIVYRQPMEVITASTQNFDLENYFFRALKYAVAVDIAPEFRVDAQTVRDLKELKGEAMAVVSSIHPENTDAYFQPGID